MKFVLIPLTIVLCVSFVGHCQAMAMGTIGLYIDEARSGHCVYGSGFAEVEMWCWCEPDDDGFKSVVLRVRYPDNIIPATVTYTDNLSGVNGTLGDGAVIGFLDCQTDWCWPFHQTLYITSADSSMVQLVPYPSDFPWAIPADISFLACGSSEAKHAERISNLGVNHCPEDVDPPLIEYVEVVDNSHIEVLYSEEVAVATAENVDHYVAYLRLGGTDSIMVSNATLLGDGRTVALDLATPFMDNTPYVLQSYGVEDMAGNTWETYGQFGNGPDLIVPYVNGPDTVNGCPQCFDATFKVTNIGSYPAGVFAVMLSIVMLDDDGNEAGEMIITPYYYDGLAPGDTVTEHFFDCIHPLWGSEFRFHNRVTVTVDTDEIVDEAREHNNVGYDDMIVPKPRITDVTHPGGGNDVTVEFVRALFDSTAFMDPVTVYEVYRANQTLGGYDLVASVPADYSYFYTVDFPPEPGEEYTYFYIRAVRPSGGITHHYPSCEHYYKTGADVAPRMPEGFAGRQIGEDRLLLTWNRNREPDVYWYYLYRGTTPDFPADEAHRFSPIFMDTFRVDTSWSIDSLFYYKLSAVDMHYNESDHALLAPENLIATFLLGFEARTKESVVELKWEVTTTDAVPEFCVSRRSATDALCEVLPGEVFRISDTEFRYVDAAVEPGRSYIYRVSTIENNMRKILFETHAVRIPSLSLTLYQNHPNPFNPLTVVEFYLPRDGEVTLNVYDVSGRRIACLVHGGRKAGKHTVEWNGLDDTGTAVASGIYFYQISFGKERITRKMILLR
ncbi:MAG: T9SS type A sorting domain-containing protein [bacterium]|nr:MAG: T9SS type A sorting domain-containing protein [bacterium]